MRLLTLSLASFRNYRSLEHAFSGAPVILLGGNAQGKSNLLEAITVAATARSPRTSTDRDLLAWAALEDDVPAARVHARLATGQRVVEVEVALAADLASVSARQARPGSPVRLRKRLRVNGIPRRASDLIGQAAVVTFDPESVGLLAGDPGQRRAFLDAAIAQLDRQALRAMADLQRVLPQRNALLRRIAEGQASPDLLDFWDDRLVQAASVLIGARRRYLADLEGPVQALHDRFAPGSGSLRLAYRSTLARYGEEPEAEEALPAALRAALEGLRGREIRQGVTLLGPQRDDFEVTLEGVNLHQFGSRGQQRTVAICLKLAEARHLEGVLGSRPLLLLDELFAELDAARRRQMQEEIAGWEQPFITATDLDHLAPALVRAAEVLRVREGVLVPA